MTSNPPAPVRALSSTVAVAACVIALAGCGSAPQRPPGPVVSAPASTPAPAAQTSRRGGGYYKDDGPGDDIPANLDDVPDAQPRFEPLHRFANRPYNVFGKDYVPATELVAHRERGYASWYGRRFHGKPTSSGEPYDMYGMTAAHPTLPIPSYVRVTNAANARSVVVRINDRGPFHKDRIIDLSYAAAHRLGYINAGSAIVEVETILPNEVEMVAGARPVPPLRGREQRLTEVPEDERLQREDDAIERVAGEPRVSPGGRIGLQAGAGVFLQLGVFSSVANAEGFLGLVREEFASFADRLEVHDDGDRFRLRLGPFASADEARSEAGRIAEVLKIHPFVVTR